MKNGDKFFLISIATVFLIRFFEFLLNKHIILDGFVVHHFWTGILLVLICCFISNSFLKLILYGIGLGLIADESVFIVIGGNTNLYWTIPSIAGAIFSLAILFLFRKKIVDFQEDAN
jgi:hypothetical protein